jgi:hypothetical protein
MGWDVNTKQAAKHKIKNNCDRRRKREPGTKASRMYWVKTSRHLELIEVTLQKRTQEAM